MAELIDELLVRLGLETDAKGFREANSMFSGIRGSALATGAAIGGAYAGLAKISDGVAKSRDSLAKWADTANVSTKRAQELAYALRQVGGTEADMMSMFDNMNQLRDQARLGTLPTEAFEVSGIDLYSILRLENEAALDQLMRAISSVKDPDQRRRLSSALNFSSPAQRAVMENYDRTNSDYRRAGELGGIADQDLFDKSAAYTAALTELEQAAQGLKDVVAGQLLPGMTELVEGITGFVVENREEIAEFLAEAMPYLQTMAAGIGVLVAVQAGKKGLGLINGAMGGGKGGKDGAKGGKDGAKGGKGGGKGVGGGLVQAAVIGAAVNAWDWDAEDAKESLGISLPKWLFKPMNELSWNDFFGDEKAEEEAETERYGSMFRGPGRYEPPGGEALAGSSTTTVTVPITVDARGATDPVAVEAAARRAVEAGTEGLIKTARQEFPGNRD